MGIEVTASLGDFLSARIAEDEAVAREWPDTFGPPPEGFAFWVDPQGRPIYQPRTRVLAECTFKREIVRLWNETEEGTYGDQGPTVAAETAYALAAIYADHPDYREEWRP